MKNFTFLIGLFILISCSPSKEELLISDYEQTVGNTKTNLNLKFNKLEFIKDITSKDSLEILNKYFNEQREGKIKQIKEEIVEEIEQKERYEMDLKNEKDNSEKFVYKSLINSNERIIKFLNESIDLFNGDCKGTFLEGTFIKIEKLKTNLDSILTKEYEVVYTIINPMLNNVEQTISKTYYLNSDITKILKVSDD